MRTSIKRGLALAGTGLGLLLLFHAEENLRGRLAWNRWQRTQRAQGQIHDRLALIPPELPAADNFAAAPVVDDAVQGRPPKVTWALPAAFITPPQAGLAWTGQVADRAAWKAAAQGQAPEEVLRPLDAQLDAWAEAARRPGSRLLLDYRDPNAMPTFISARAMARALRARALARLDRHQPDLALQDLEAGYRMVGHLQHEPLLLPQLLRLAWSNILLQPVWEGLAGHAWNEAQLARLEAVLARPDLVASLKLGWAYERASADVRNQAHLQDTWNEVFLNPGPDAPAPGRLRRLASRLLVPRGWVYQNLRVLDQAQADLVGRVLDPAAHRVHPEAQEAVLQPLRAARGPFSRLAASDLPAIAQQNIRVARAQAGLDLARVACALERHRLAHQAYPKALAELVPAYLPSVPKDIVNGQDLHYQPLGRTYKLYSVGWNLKDEGGVPAPVTGTGTQDPAAGDWVWFAEPQAAGR